MAKKQFKLMIGIPSMAEWKAKTSLSIGLLMVNLAFPQKEYDHHYIVQNERGSILPQLRQGLVDKALKENATHLLMIDSDMTFPETLATDWMREDFPVIAANCPTKSVPCHPTARYFDGKTGAAVYSDLATQRYERVWRVGTGIMMLRRDALEALPRPCFTPYWHEEQDRYVYEDWKLCEHLEALDIPIRVDHQVSMEVGHIGDYEFKHSHVAVTRKQKAIQELKVA